MPLFYQLPSNFSSSLICSHKLLLESTRQLINYISQNLMAPCSSHYHHLLWSNVRICRSFESVHYFKVFECMWKVESRAGSSFVRKSGYFYDFEGCRFIDLPRFIALITVLDILWGVGLHSGVGDRNWKNCRCFKHQHSRHFQRGEGGHIFFTP